MLTSLQTVHRRNWGRVWGDLITKIFGDAGPAGAFPLPESVRGQTLGELSQNCLQQMAPGISHVVYRKLELRIPVNENITIQQLLDDIRGEIGAD